MKVLAEFDIELSGHLSRKESEKAIGCINMHYLGDEECNHIFDGEMVSKYPEKETKEFKDAYFNIKRRYVVKATIQLMEDGTFRTKCAK